MSYVLIFESFPFPFDYFLLKICTKCTLKAFFHYLHNPVANRILICMSLFLSSQSPMHYPNGFPLFDHSHERNDSLGTRQIFWFRPPPLSHHKSLKSSTPQCISGFMGIHRVPTNPRNQFVCCGWGSFLTICSLCVSVFVEVNLNFDLINFQFWLGRKASEYDFTCTAFLFFRLFPWEGIGYLFTKVLCSGCWIII